MVKTYVLDTNILESTEGRAILGFDDNEVIITHTTQEELDKHKEIRGSELGYQARQTIKLIESILDNKKPEESVLKGIKLSNGGTFRIVTNYLQSTMPVGWSLERPDNRILCTTKTLAEQGINNQVILITNDTSMKTKAIAMDIPVQKYQNDQLVTDEFYSGRTQIKVTDTCINKIFKEKELNIPTLANKNHKENLLIEEGDEILFNNLVENEFVVLEGITGGSALAWRKGDTLKLIGSENKPLFGVTAKNVGQKFALEALKAAVDDCPLVILKGPAGCGKTLLALAVGLSYTYDSKYNRTYDSIVITRSNTLTDEDLGYLPGDLEDKMEPLLAPFFDNLRFLLGQHDEEKTQIRLQIEDMIESGVIEITSLSYIRGRSLRNTFLIVDEAQNLTRLQAKTIATRIGQGSKLIIAGDPNQIDNSKLDKKNNGLIYLSESMKGSPLCAQVEFSNSECVRSKLAIEAINRL